MLEDEGQQRRSDKVEGPRLEADQRKRPIGNGVGLAALICTATKKLLDRAFVPPQMGFRMSSVSLTNLVVVCRHMLLASNLQSTHALQKVLEGRAFLSGCRSLELGPQT